MATFLYDFVNNLNENWKEVDLLLLEAKKYENSNVDLYNALCRSITVLIVAHLEGFIKELVKAIIHDLNKNYTFKELSKSIQKTYCLKYLGNETDTNSKSYQNKVNRLSEKFCELECKISDEPFFINNRNPKPDTLQTVFKNFGVKSVFAHLHDSKLDSVFSESAKTTREDIQLQKAYILKSVISFPYSGDISRMNLEKAQGTMSKRTLWEEFLDQINMKRHGVAHGTNTDNSESVSVLETIKDKVVYLQLVLIELLVCEITKMTVNKTTVS